MTHVGFLAALQFETPILHDRLLTPGAGSRFDGDTVFPRFRDGTDRAGGDVRGNEGVAMTRVHHERVRGNAGILLQGRPHLGKEGIVDRSDLGHRHRIDRDDHRIRPSLGQDESLHHRRILLRRMIGVGDVDLRDSGEKRLGSGMGRNQ